MPIDWRVPHIPGLAMALAIRSPAHVLSTIWGLMRLTAKMHKPVVPNAQFSQAYMKHYTLDPKPENTKCYCITYLSPKQLGRSQPPLSPTWPTIIARIITEDKYRLTYRPAYFLTCLLTCIT